MLEPPRLEPPRYDEQAGPDEVMVRYPPTPPPEVPSSGQGRSLLWKGPASGLRSCPARHPLLAAASEARTATRQGRGRGHFLAHVLAPARRGRSLAHASATVAEMQPPALQAGRSRSRPLVVVTAGGRGGTGRTTLALEVATSLALAADGPARRVLLVDADPFQPDLDLRLGAAGVAAAWPSNASLDQILQQLPELADKRVSLESLLWVDRESGVRALFAAGRFAEVGREHLDYLYTNMVAPTFDAIVVDAGHLLEVPTGRMQEPAAFWLGLASTILIPLRPTASHVRSAVNGISVLERMGIEVQICRLIMGVEKSETAAAAHWQGQLGDLVVLRWPWIADLARKSASMHRSLSVTDQRFAAKIAGLLPALMASRSFER